MTCIISFHLSFSAVLDTVIEELKNILKRDFNKRMIEATAFKTFEAWWDEQERKFKVLQYCFYFFTLITHLLTTNLIYQAHIHGLVICTR